MAISWKWWQAKPYVGKAKIHFGMHNSQDVATLFAIFDIGHPILIHFSCIEGIYGQSLANNNHSVKISLSQTLDWYTLE